MRDDLFCFEFMGHRVCVQLDERSETGWSYTIDGTDVPPSVEHLPYAQRALLEEAGIVAREHIRSVQAGFKHSTYRSELFGPTGQVSLS